MAPQFQRFVNEADCLTPCLWHVNSLDCSGGQPEEIPRQEVHLLVVLDLSVEVDTSNHGGLLERRLNLWVGGTVLIWQIPEDGSGGLLLNLLVS